MLYRDGGELLVELLRQSDVDTVFGVVSIHNLPLVAAVDAALRFVPVRHEAAAVNAADGYARARRGLGCALTSTGTGAGNAAGALVEALAAGSSVLHITGQIPIAYLGQGRGFIHETRDQAGMLAAVSTSCHTVRSAAESGEVLARAAAEALSAPGGPVSVEWPIDLQYAPCDEPIAVAPPAAPVEFDPDALRDAVQLLGAASRPVVWAGGGAVGAGAQLRELVERLDAPLLTSNAGRGVLDEGSELCVGNYASTPQGQALLDDADLLLSIGTHFRSNETATYRLRMPPAHIQLDVDPAAVGRVYPVKVGLVGDAARVLSAVLRELGESATAPGWRARAAEVRTEVRAVQRAGIGVQAAICDALAAVLPPTGVVARDVTIPASSWGNRLLPIHDPRGNIFARGGGIGQGLAMGIGAALGRDDPVVVIVGDGGLALCMGELLTVAQERPRLTVLVFNDGGYGVLRNMQVASGQPRAGVDLRTPDFATLARAVQLGYERIADPARAEPVLAKAVAADRPTLVEVDVAALGEMPTPFVPPVEVPS